MALIHPLMNEVDTSVWRPKQRHQRSLGQPSHPPSVHSPALFRLIRSLRSCTSSSPLFASDAAVRSETWVFFWWAISILCYFTFLCSCIISTMCGNTEYIENKYCLSLSSIVTQLLVFIISIIHFFVFVTKNRSTTGQLINLNCWCAGRRRSSWRSCLSAYKSSPGQGLDALCTINMYYALCTMHSALCTVPYALCR